MAITRQKDSSGSEPDKGSKPPREKAPMKVAAETPGEESKSDKGSSGRGEKGGSSGGGKGGGKGGKGDGSQAPVAKSVHQIVQFLREAMIEFRKITWPTGREIVRTTYSVLFLIAVITIAVLAFDYLVAQFFFSPIEHWARLHGGGVGVVGR
jgi:preprotein translocase SecE subunit